MGDDRAAGGGVRAWLRTPAARQLGVVALVSLFLRAWTLSQMRAGNPLFQAAELDDAVYLDAAQRFVDGAPAGAWFLAPLYPWLLGLVATLGGVETVTMRLASGVSLACGVGTSVLVAATARRIAGPAAGWISGLLHAAAATFVFHELIPGQEAVLSLLYVGALALALHWHRTRAWWAVAAFGVVAGVAALGRGTAVLLLPAALPLVLGTPPASVPEDRRARGRAWAAPAVALLGALLVLAPAALRNASVTGDTTPFTWSFGPNVYAANSPEGRVSGTYHSADLGSTPAQMERNARRIAELREGRELRPGEISAWWRDRTLDELSTGPGLAGHVWTKTQLLFADHPFGTSHSLVAEARFATWTRLAPGGAWWLLALAFSAWWLVRRGEPLADVVALAFALTAVALLVVYPANRYRLAVLTAGVVLIGPGIVRLRTAAPAGRAVAAALVVVVAVLAQLPHRSGRFPHMYAVNRANVGQLLLRSGRAAEAVAVLEEADRDEPGSVDVLASLAPAYDAAGRPRDAAAAAEEHGRIIDTLPAGRVRTVLDLALRGRRDPADLERAEALGRELLPTLLNDDLRTRLWANLAVVAAFRGDRGEAELRLERARQIDPDLDHLRVARSLVDE